MIYRRIKDKSNQFIDLQEEKELLVLLLLLKRHNNKQQRRIPIFSHDIQSGHLFLLLLCTAAALFTQTKSRVYNIDPQLP